jgi:hypothetical protein
MAQPLANEDRSDIVRIGQPAVRWGQGIPIRPLTTTQSLPGSVPSRAATVPTSQSSATPAASTPSYVAPPHMTSRPLLPLGIETPTSSALSSVSDAVTRLQRERDLALRRIDELHAYYKREQKASEESRAQHNSSLNNSFIKVSGDLELTKQQLDQVQSLCETQSLMRNWGRTLNSTLTKIHIYAVFIESTNNVKRITRTRSNSWSPTYGREMTSGPERLRG